MYKMPLLLLLYELVELVGSMQVRCAVSSMLLNTREVFDVHDRSSAYSAMSCRFNSSAWSGVLFKTASSVSTVTLDCSIETTSSGQGTIPMNGRPSYHTRSLIW
jgi:hypothetical protein